MLDLGENINLEEVDEDDPFAPIPEGQYDCEVVGAEIKRTKSGTGMMLVVSLSVVEGKHSGYQLMDWINYQNQHETAQRIGRQKLKSLCRCAGVKGTVSDISPILNRRVCAVVSVEDKYTGDGKVNKVEQYLPPHSRVEKEPVKGGDFGKYTSPDLSDDDIPF